MIKKKKIIIKHKLINLTITKIQKLTNQIQIKNQMKLKKQQIKLYKSRMIRKRINNHLRIPMEIMHNSPRKQMKKTSNLMNVMKRSNTIELILQFKKLQFLKAPIIMISIKMMI